MKKSFAETKMKKKNVSISWKYLAIGSIALLLISVGVVGVCYYKSLNYNKYGFPYGKFSNGIIEAEFNKDGTAVYKSDYEHWRVPVKYAINENYYTEMMFNYPNTPKIPATYTWEYDGEKITFTLWGKDDNAHRKYVMTYLPYKRVK